MTDLDIVAEKSHSKFYLSVPDIKFIKIKCINLQQIDLFINIPGMFFIEPDL